MQKIYFKFNDKKDIRLIVITEDDKYTDTNKTIIYSLSNNFDAINDSLTNLLSAELTSDEQLADIMGLFSMDEAVRRCPINSSYGIIVQEYCKLILLYREILDKMDWRDSESLRVGLVENPFAWEFSYSDYLACPARSIFEEVFADNKICNITGWTIWKSRALRFEKMILSVRERIETSIYLKSLSSNAKQQLALEIEKDIVNSLI